MFPATAILSSLILSAAESRVSQQPPTLTFNGTTATRYVFIAALGKPITATLELWHGNSCIASWSDSGTSRLIISETETVVPGQTYTPEVNGTIDEVPFTGTPVTGTC